MKRMKYPRKFKVREITLKADKDTWSLLKIQRTIQNIVKMDKIADDVGQMFYKWDFWIGYIKNQRRK